MNHKKGLCLFARLILPIESPPIENGYLLIKEGRIADFGRKHDLSISVNNFAFIDCGDSVLFPAFVNAHAHLDYTCLYGKIPPQKSFSDWVKEIVKSKKQLSLEDYRNSWKSGAEMLLKTGCAVVASIESCHDLIPEMWEQTDLIIFSFLEIIGVKEKETSIIDLLIKKRQEIKKTKRQQLAISPHSLYSLKPEFLENCLKFIKQKRTLASIHIAESREEYEMFKHGRGKLMEWLNSLGRGNADCGYGSPVQTLYNYSPPEGLILVHANYIEDRDLELMKSNGASVAHCPRSFAYFGHAQFRFEKLIKNKINVCLGTDSLASIEKKATDKKCDRGLNMFSEMRQFASSNPGIEPKLILKMSALNGAKALGIEKKCGDIHKGMLANLVCVPFEGKTSEAYEAVINYDGESVGFSIIGGKLAYVNENYRDLFCQNNQ